MSAAIRLDITTEAAACDTCPAVNEAMARLHDAALVASLPGTFIDDERVLWSEASGNALGGLEQPTAIYRLTIGAGYRQPTYLCPDCLAKLRLILGVEIRTAPCDTAYSVPAYMREESI